VDKASLDIKQKNTEALRELFPNIFSEGEIDLEKFKAAFCEAPYFSNERYTLNWAGKADAFRILQERTTAQAVLELNKEDSGNRKFILVQLPELCDENSEASKAGYKTIADISRERIKRAIQKIGNGAGFKSFKLSPSNFKVWRSEEITEENIEQQMEMFIDPVKPES